MAELNLTFRHGTNSDRAQAVAAALAFVLDFGFLPQKFIDANDRCGTALDQIDDIPEGEHGKGQLRDEDHVRGELAGSDLVLHHLPAAEKQRDNEGDGKDELERRPQHGHQPDKIQGAMDVLAVGFFKLGDLRLFLREGADQPSAGEVLLSFRGNIGKHGLNAFEAHMDLAAHILHQH